MIRFALWLLLALSIPTACHQPWSFADERLERFDKDPGWDSHNSRAVKQEPRMIKQDFGYSATAHAGGEAGEIGGFITPAAEAGYYGKKLKPLTFDDAFEASGKLICKGRQFHVLLGLFNADTVNDWRTPNTIAIRLMGRGDRFFAFVEYATSRWRAGGDTPGGFALVKEPDTGRMQLRGFQRDVVYPWSLRYDPKGNKGGGSISVTLGGETSVCHFDQGHRADGATFNRFGLLNVMKSADDPGELFLDDIAINGQTESFARDPQWESRNNRATYKTTNIRPHFDFGFSPTQHAGGQGAGELGGLVFRGDCRYPEKMAYYGDRVGPLSMEQPLRASGKISMRRGVSDSTTLLGFFHAKDSMTVNPSQASGFPKSFLGIAVEGPSREGFLCYPVYRMAGDAQGHGSSSKAPHILPDGKPHDWSLEYDPKGADGRGRITVTFDKKSVTLDLPPGHRAQGARFDRFGLVTTWVDGNGQHVYFDDLRYTSK